MEHTHKYTYTRIRLYTCRLVATSNWDIPRWRVMMGLGTALPLESSVGPSHRIVVCLSSEGLFVSFKLEAREKGDVRKCMYTGFSSHVYSIPGWNWLAGTSLASRPKGG